MDNTEIWRPIKGFEGLYEVSNNGRVKGIDRIIKHNKGGAIVKKSGLLKGGINSKGYLQVKLSVDGKTFVRAVHRLVALAFLPDQNPAWRVNHIDRNRLNNHVSNLELIRPEKNVQQVIDAGIWLANTKKRADSTLTEVNVETIISDFKKMG